MRLSDSLACLSALILTCIAHDAAQAAQSRAPQAAPAARRPITLDDYYAIKEVSSVELSPDGRMSVYVVRTIDRNLDDRTSTLWRVPVAGGTPQQLTSGSRMASTPRFAPDGRHVAFLAEADDESQVFILPAGGGEAFKVTALPGGVSDFDWSPDSRRLVLVSGEPTTDGREGTQAAVAVDRAPRRPTPNPIVVTRLRHKEDGIGYLTRQHEHLYLADIGTALDTSGDRTAIATPLTTGSYDEGSPAWSPDGRTIAFTSNRSNEPDDNYDLDVWTVDIASSQIERVTSDPGEDT